MRLFLDTANTAEWHLPAGCPPLAGVTTNPTLVYAAGLAVNLNTYQRLLAAAIELQIPALMLQLPSVNASASMAMAEQLSKQNTVSKTNLTFKLPCHPSWQTLHTALRSNGYSTLLTGVSNPMQLLWAQALDANYVAPYLSRIAADGRNIQALIAACVAIQNAGGPKLMAASVKISELFCQLLAAGAAAVTVKPDFAASLALDALSNAAFEQFERDISASLGV